MTISGISGNTPGAEAPDRLQRMQSFMQKLQGDSSPEAQTLQGNFQKLMSDMQSGTANAQTLQDDRKAVHDAMRAYRTAKGDNAQQAQATGKVRRGHHGHHHHHHKAEAAAPTQPTDANAQPGSLVDVQA